MCIIFADVCVMGIQIIGLFVTVFIRPFYIARYSVVILGIFAILVAFGVKDIKPKPSKVICTLLCVLNIGCLVATGLFEYNPSMTNFVKDSVLNSQNQTLLFTATVHSELCRIIIRTTPTFAPTKKTGLRHLKMLNV